jgi:hypothetical protein
VASPRYVCDPGVGMILTRTVVVSDSGATVRKKPRRCGVETNRPVQWRPFAWLVGSIFGLLAAACSPTQDKFIAANPADGADAWALQRADASAGMSCAARSGLSGGD